ncbi:allophanate hydrolase 2 subunit 2 [Klebsiella pneumoniae]|uniref:Allophanate hydrolase 2 subunit 2 n=1 Tax=Klebsiella pneumoniae TaxID=573 RepID=A0A4P0XZ77_KLEPN|nr:allophanate hydrolase 2 subunit 2 [Klebsiella pneumoniae]
MACCPGVVQVPHNGQPIVLMNDAQTTGGYPRIACIIEADMYQLAQIPLGQPIHFVPCSLEEALKRAPTSSATLNNWPGG